MVVHGLPVFDDPLYVYRLHSSDPFRESAVRPPGAKLGKNVQFNSKYVFDASLLEIGDSTVVGGGHQLSYCRAGQAGLKEGQDRKPRHHRLAFHDQVPAVK